MPSVSTAPISATESGVIGVSPKITMVPVLKGRSPREYVLLDTQQTHERSECEATEEDVELHPVRPVVPNVLKATAILGDFHRSPLAEQYYGSNLQPQTLSPNVSTRGCRLSARADSRHVSLFHPVHSC